jgi:hypothetical protein
MVLFVCVRVPECACVCARVCVSARVSARTTLQHNSLGDCQKQLAHLSADKLIQLAKLVSHMFVSFLDSLSIKGNPIG